MRFIFDLFNKLAKASQKRVDHFGAQYRAFGLYTVFNYPIGFLILYYLESQENESIWLRLFACMLCLPLIFHAYWPQKLKYYLPIYWHLTLVYCMPFLGAVMLLRNGFSMEWQLNILLGFFIFLLLVDWLTFLLLISLGFLLGIVFYCSTGGSFNVFILDARVESISFVWYLYFYAILIGAVFARNQEKIKEVKLEALKSLAYSIAHEMRTPLASIAAGASNLGKFLPVFKLSYQKASEAGLLENKINNAQLERIFDIPIVMEKVSYNAQNIINMLLMKVRDANIAELEPCSIANCVKTALQQYPLREKELKSIKWDESQDFIFVGKEEMFLHVLFNLLKNSLHQINLIDNGVINIWIDDDEKYNYLHFKDNGKGISKKILTNIFDRFVSGTEFGTGMGLAYCKMAMTGFGGDIDCISAEGVGAEFILSFPKIVNEESSISHESADREDAKLFETSVA